MLEASLSVFEHGGWHLPYFDEMSQAWVVNYLTETGGFLLGRVTYENFAGHWPHASEEEQVVAVPLNTKPKFVASTTLSEPLAWENSNLLKGNVGEAIRSLKDQDGGDLHVLGSTQLVATLMEHDLIDEVRLMIDPIVLGGGKRIFQENGALRSLKLRESKSTTTGALLATYEVDR